MCHLTIRKHGRKAPTEENTPEGSESAKRASTSKKRARADDSALNKASKTKHVSQHVESEEDEIGVQKAGIGIEAKPDQLRDAKRDAGKHRAPERS